MTQIDTKFLMDKAFHERIKANPKQELLKLGYKEENLTGKEIILATNTKDTLYIAMPENYDAIDLANIDAAAGISLGSIACLSTAGSVSSVCSCASTISTGATGGTVGCAVF